MLRKYFLLTLVLFHVFFVSNNAYAQDNTKNKIAVLLGFEYLSPIDRDRNIDTYILDVFYPVAEISPINLRISALASFAYATGDITQIEGEYSEGTMHDVNYKNSAFALGPGVQLDWRVFKDEQLSFHLEGIGNLFIYNDKFPAGGKYYNFMWRIGPSVYYKLDNSSKVGVGYHWSHASNGTGVRPENPSYDAEGVFIRYSRLF
ncbi:hypothetical protein tinsulaeT_05630 [Thalassotalea insulae]|uniref:Lipid A 3-O-deacylase PagL n=1 Tax=Thalassotalea insulae TaxID=2056778 RepID=A0ABQ6GMK4_9GAMM|nr:hypothetical protein [Thalassotalea insulae]GLX77223.1 hypothetical protein tinsulaeT_05630 [Thalassotalea insulae]